MLYFLCLFCCCWVIGIFNPFPVVVAQRNGFPSQHFLHCIFNFDKTLIWQKNSKLSFPISRVSTVMSNNTFFVKHFCRNCSNYSLFCNSYSLLYKVQTNKLLVTHHSIYNSPGRVVLFF